MSSDSKPKSPLLPIATCVAWLVCAAAALLGVVLAYPRPHAPAEADAYQPTQIVDARLAPQPPPPPVPVPLPPPDPGTPSSDPPTAAPAPPPVAPQPALVAVAPPSPAISFALPTEGLTRVVDVAHADFTRSVPTATGPAGTGHGPPAAPAPPPPPIPAASAPAITHLTIGQGEGRQPLPQYPREAVLAGQEGTVGLRFTVGEDGRVQSVEVVSPSRWPLLNQAASRAVRETWRFTPGPRRIYEVPIEFQLGH